MNEGGLSPLSNSVENFGTESYESSSSAVR